MDARIDALRMWRRLTGWAAAVLRERDRIWSWAALPAYGLWSMLGDPTPSMQVLPPHVQTATYLLLIVAGLSGAWGQWRDRWPWWVVGHLLAVTGLLTVAGVVALRSESPVAALLAGYACTLAYDLQRATRERQSLLRSREVGR